MAATAGATPGWFAGDGASLLVDTLFDLPLTREMLAAMKPITDGAPITDALITHSNGDHTHGNQLLDASVRIIAATGTAEEIAHGMAPEMLAMTQTGNLGPVASPYARDRFGHFDFSGITLRNADLTFDRELTIDVGGRQVKLLNLGPAHTAADSVVHVPDAGVLFGGDLLFIGCTPIVWAGPIANWIAACDTMIALDAPIVVPGHGPVTDPDGIRSIRGYFVHITEQIDAARGKGLSWSEAADTIDLGEYAGWLDAERVVVNVYQRYRELDPDTPQLEVMALLVMQAEWLAKRPAWRSRNGATATLSGRSHRFRPAAAHCCRCRRRRRRRSARRLCRRCRRCRRCRSARHCPRRHPPRRWHPGDSALTTGAAVTTVAQRRTGATTGPAGATVIDPARSAGPAVAAVAEQGGGSTIAASSAGGTGGIVGQSAEPAGPAAGVQQARIAAVPAVAASPAGSVDAAVATGSAAAEQ